MDGLRHRKNRQKPIQNNADNKAKNGKGRVSCY